MKNKRMSLSVWVGIFLLTILSGYTAIAGVSTGSVDAYNSEWYMQPWIWLLSGGLFVLIFTVIISREDKRDA